MRNGLFFVASWVVCGCAIDSVPDGPVRTLIDDNGFEHVVDADVAGSGLGPIDFATHSAYSLQTSGDATFDIGPTWQRTCYLAGVAGSLSPLLGHDSRYLAIEVAGNDYQIHITTNGTMKVWARCVPAPAQMEYQWHSSDSPVLIGPFATGSGCYLTSIRATSLKSGASPFSDSGDNVTLTHDSSWWSLGGGFAEALGFYEVFATARCTQGTDSDGTYTASATPGNIDITPMTSVAGASCGLQRVKGVFTTTDPSDGIIISRDSDTHQYFLTAINDKAGKATCIN